MTTGLYGGAFDPPHNGHVALVADALAHFGLDAMTVLVSGAPAHKQPLLDAETRVRLARAAFPEHDVVLDRHARTVDTLREGRWADPLFLVGADEFADFLDWKEPDAVLDLARLGVATRPGYARSRVDSVLAQISRPDRVELFEIQPVPVSSSDIRARVGRGEPVDGLVPASVAELIAAEGLYGQIDGAPGYT